MGCGLLTPVDQRCGLRLRSSWASFILVANLAWCAAELLAFSLPSVADFCLSGVLLRDRMFQRRRRFTSLLADEEPVVSRVELNIEEVDADVLADRFMALNC